MCFKSLSTSKSDIFNAWQSFGRLDIINTLMQKLKWLASLEYSIPFSSGHKQLLSATVRTFRAITMNDSEKIGDFEV